MWVSVAGGTVTDLLPRVGWPKKRNGRSNGEPHGGSTPRATRSFTRGTTPEKSDAVPGETGGERAAGSLAVASSVGAQEPGTRIRTPSQARRGCVSGFHLFYAAAVVLGLVVNVFAVYLVTAR